MRLIVTAITALAIILAAFAAPAAANPPQEFEHETVESLQLAGDTNSRVVFLYEAPTPTCVDAQGFTRFNDCPAVTWICPAGITHGALDRFARDMTYNELIAGFQALDTMCLLQATPNPQPAPTPTPAPDPVDPPALAFTGAETSVLGYVGAGLIAFGSLALGARRKYLK